MKKEFGKIRQIRNWLGKAFLFFLGIVWLLAVSYHELLYMFMLTEKVPPPWTTPYYVFLICGLAFIAGGVYLNNILDGFSRAFRNIITKITG